MNKIYLVSYCGGSHEDYYRKAIFATTKKATAAKYVAKFNRILQKWKQHYSKFEQIYYSSDLVKDEYLLKYFDRWHSLDCITECYFEEVPVR